MKKAHFLERLLLVLFLSLIANNNLTAADWQDKGRNYLHKNITLDQMKSMLITDQKWVTFPDYTDRQGWDKLTANHKIDLIKKGEQYLQYEWKVIKATDYLAFDRTGNRSQMEKPFGDNNRALVHLVMAELAEGKGRFMDPIIDGIFHTCEMTTWALAAHLNAQPIKGSLPYSKFHYIDLTAGDLGNMLAWTYYFLHEEFDKINPEISRRLYEELDKRIMTAYMENDSFWWLGFKNNAFVNNWNPWCNSNALMAFMLLEKDIDRLAKAVYRSMISVDQFYNYVKEDGACEEGPSYWGHAHGKGLDYLSLLQTITGGKINLFQNPQIKSMGEYILRSYVGNGWVVNFADASAKGGGDPYVIYRYGKAVESIPMKQFAAYLYHQQGTNINTSSRDIYRILEALKVDAELQAEDTNYVAPKFSWYPQTEFCYIRNAKAFVAMKGGYNDESHNHNDAGTFSLWVKNTPLFIDAGVGTYTRETFSSKRYNIWTMQSNYHNLPMINGVPQKHGREYKASHVQANKNRFSADIAKAYPSEAEVKSWIRSYELKNKELVVRDCFELNEILAANQLNFLTWGDIQLNKGTVAIEVQGVKATLEYDADAFDVKKETIQLKDKKLSNVWGEQVYRLSFTAKKLVKKDNYLFKVKF